MNASEAPQHTRGRRNPIRPQAIGHSLNTHAQGEDKTQVRHSLSTSNEQDNVHTQNLAPTHNKSASIETSTAPERPKSQTGRLDKRVKEKEPA